MAKLTNEELKKALEERKIEAQKRADELSEELKVKVHAIVFVDEEDGFVVGYITEPNRFTKTRVLDKGMMSPTTAAVELLEAILLKEHSDKRIWEERPEWDKFFHGAAMAAYDLVSISVDQMAKKK
jgi:hypothetical protein